ETRGNELDALDDIKAKRHHILEAAYKDLSDKAKKLLSQIAALGDSLTLDIIEVFNPFLPHPPDEVEEPDDKIMELENQLSEVESDEEKAIIESQIYEELAKPSPERKAYNTYREAVIQYEKQL